MQRANGRAAVTADHGDSWSALPLTLSLDLSFDGLPDGQLTSTLADLRQVGSGETLSDLREEVQIHVLQVKNPTQNEAAEKRNSDQNATFLGFLLCSHQQVNVAFD